MSNVIETELQSYAVVALGNAAALYVLYPDGLTVEIERGRVLERPNTELRSYDALYAVALLAIDKHSALVTSALDQDGYCVKIKVRFSNE